MPSKAQSHDDDIVMGLVELTLAAPAEERESYLRKTCGQDTELFRRVWQYVESEYRMKGFLLDPLNSPPPAEHVFEPGVLLHGRFRIVREVARGGMGIVYDAKDEKLERRIALKCAKPGFQNRLPPEVRSASEISHPNVCKIFEIHTALTDHGNVDFITMEFLEGETLSEKLRRGLTKPEARSIALQICAALAEAHRHGVVHGDLKSNNVILTTAADGTMRAVVTDFGLARRPQGSGLSLQPGLQAGTPAYMAPELWTGQGSSLTSDVYALGVILHELVLGQLPQDSGATAVDWAQSRHVQRRTATFLPRKWDRVIARCLDPDPARRFQDATHVARALAPSQTRRLFVLGAAAIVLAVISSVLTYETARPPMDLVRLAVLPFETDAASKPLSEGLLLETGGRLSHVKPGRARLTLLPLGDALQNRVEQPAQARTMLGATHSLSGTLRTENGRIQVNAYLTDTRSLVRVAEWHADYAENELAAMPGALAGMVTGTLRLPPVVEEVTMNAAAYPDYVTGTSLARRYSDVDRALPLLERAVAADPSSPLIYASLADAQFSKYQVMGDAVWRDRAWSSLRKAEQRNPDSAAIRFVSGRMNDNDGRYEQAEADYKRAIELEETSGDAWRRLGTTYEHENRPNEALAAYLKAIELQPEYFRNYQNLGEFHLRRGDYEEAAKQYKKMVELAADLPEAHYQLATPYLNLGRYNEAEQELNIAIGLKELPVAVHGLGLLRMLQNQDAQAIPYLKRALEIGPKTSGLYLNLGTAFRRSGFARESEEAYRNGLAAADAKLGTNPRDAGERANLAYLCARLGDRRCAESEIAQAMQLSRGANSVRGMAAQTYEALGLHERTMEVLDDASASLLSQLNRLPDLADLRRFPRFQQLLETRHVH